MASEVSPTVAAPTDLSQYSPPPKQTMRQPPTFLTLPAEIRLRIYKLLFDEIWVYEDYEEEDCCYTHDCSRCRYGDNFVPAEADCQCNKYRCVNCLCHCCSPLSLGLLRVCKFVHNEAKAVFDNAPLALQQFGAMDFSWKTECSLPIHLRSRVEKLVVTTKSFSYGLLRCHLGLTDFENL